MGNLLEKYEIFQTIRLSGKIRNITDINFLTFFFINLLCLFIFIEDLRLRLYHLEGYARRGRAEKNTNLKPLLNHKQKSQSRK